VPEWHLLQQSTELRTHRLQRVECCQIENVESIGRFTGDESCDQNNVCANVALLEVPDIATQQPTTAFYIRRLSD